MKGKKIMKDMIRNNWKYILFLLIFGLIGGYFTTVYSIQSISQDLLDQALAEAGSVDLIIIVGTIQSVLYAVVLGIIGKIFAEKLGLWRKFTFNKKANFELILAIVIGGSAFILLDYFAFAPYSDAIRTSYLSKPTVEYFIASVTYGAVIEEVMLRLFLMSLVAIVLKKLLKKEYVNDNILMIANIVAAIIFAAGHLPATFMTISPVTPMIIFRCFLLNGGFGLIFGRLYRKYGIHYAMLAHGGFHIVSKLIWILFI